MKKEKIREVSKIERRRLAVTEAVMIVIAVIWFDAIADLIEKTF